MRIQPETVNTLTPRCVACGYDLQGLNEFGRCPECGHAISESRKALLRFGSEATQIAQWRCSSTLLRWGFGIYILSMPLVMMFTVNSSFASLAVSVLVVGAGLFVSWGALRVPPILHAGAIGLLVVASIRLLALVSICGFGVLLLCWWTDVSLSFARASDLWLGLSNLANVLIIIFVLRFGSAFSEGRAAHVFHMQTLYRWILCVVVFPLVALPLAALGFHVMQPSHTSKAYIARAGAFFCNIVLTTFNLWSFRLLGNYIRAIGTTGLSLPRRNRGDGRNKGDANE
ncbi:hypothetical protein [Fontivita pretiosa]|uniref:hypothetical protein n=1 Tax=Fontivita pretiosa TaxID=2989684 RepID=UPI003D162C28